MNFALKRRRNVSLVLLSGKKSRNKRIDDNSVKLYVEENLILLKPKKQRIKGE
jgi:hypothetical protein